MYNNFSSDYIAVVESWAAGFSLRVRALFPFKLAALKNSHVLIELVK